ncbi:CCR4-NOT transcription complex subunit 4 [Leptonychotes weddellii]|uniref:CCR4-NOT transcription complex subunit 4 n=1 Tax=Leptonychotes weddellii TaxID=9713 RepID=A0A2U3XD36_LEPWE|nr:CCR4-NOT transcription complex subunit 4 [Leptonychotes weddellii]
MSRSPDAKEDPVECPLCMEPLEIDDINFFPCTCGYQICRFCWHRIRTDENGLCPACRKPYPEDPAVYKPLSQEELQRIKNEKKQKQNERKQKISENRKHLASVRVVQKNLVFVVGLSQRLADPEAGKHQEYEQKLLQELYKLNPNFLQLSTGSVDKNKNKVTPLQSPIDKPSDSLSIGNGDNSQQISNSDTPSPPPGLSKSNPVIPISSSNHSARSPFEGAVTESQSLFSDNFRHPNPIPSGLPPFPSSPQTSSDWPTAPEPQSLFTSETIPVSSSTDWQAAFGFGSSKQPEDDLGFDPFDVTRKALADLIEKELSVQDQPSLSPTSLQNSSSHTTMAKGPGSGFLHPAAPTNANSLNSTFSVLPQRFPQFQQHRAVYNSFSFPGQAARYPWMAFPRNSIMHLNHTANPTSNSNFLDLNLPPQHNTGLGGIPIADNSSSVESLNMKEWQDGLRALLPNININFGGLPNSSSPSNANHSAPTSNPATTDSLSWDSPGSWTDPAIITGIPATSGNSLDSLQDDNPPHWLKSLQALTEMDGPSAAPSQTHHSAPFSTQIPLHRASWNPYPPPSNPSSFHSPPPGFQTAFRPPSKTPTDLLQSSTLDRH